MNKWVAIVFTVLALFSALSFRALSTEASADFDLLGVLWVMQNLGPVFSVLLAVIFAVIALQFWLRHLLSD